MADEVLVQFVTSMIVASGNPVHHACLLEVGEISVDRTLGQPGAMLQEFGNRGRVTDVEQGVDQSASTLGVDEPTGTQTTSDFGMNAFVHLRHRDERTCDAFRDRE